MSLIVGIQFHGGGKTYHFDASGFPDLQTEDYVIVETNRGQQLGQVVGVLTHEKASKNRNRKPILRKATPRDLVLRQVWEQKEQQALEACQKLAVSDKGLQGVKFVSAEQSIDGRSLVFLYSCEEQEDPNLDAITLAIKQAYPESEIDLRRIGARDAAKIMGGMGACGREIRCCTEFMTTFQTISIKKAKAQGISLVPSEISGMCGHLRCCLDHEYELYVEARKKLPKSGKRVMTPRGEGKVVRISPLQGIVMVNLGEAGIQAFSNDEIEQVPKE